MIAKELKIYKPAFKLLSLKVMVDSLENGNTLSTAVIKIQINDRKRLSSAEGNGPVDALNNALRKAIGKLYPELEKLKLSEYKVRTISENAKGTDEQVIVNIESTYNGEKFNNVGVSEDIVKASYMAIADSIEYTFLKKYII